MTNYPIAKRIGQVDDPYFEDHLELLKDCYVQEKIDGWFLTFGFNSKGELIFKSTSKVLHRHQRSPYMAALSHVMDLKPILRYDYAYYAEVVSKPVMNKIKYHTRPWGSMLLFDVLTPRGFLEPNTLIKEARKLELIVPPIYHIGSIDYDELVKVDLNYRNVKYADKKPILKGEEIEGVVIKRLGKRTLRDHQAKLLYGFSE